MYKYAKAYLAITPNLLFGRTSVVQKKTRHPSPYLLYVGIADKGEVYFFLATQYDMYPAENNCFARRRERKIAVIVPYVLEKGTADA
jgi:hypothetical protein